MGNSSSKGRNDQFSDSFMGKLLVKELRLSQEQIMLLNQSSETKESFNFFCIKIPR
jgi:hypothetical protein